MATVAQVSKASLQKILVQGSEAPLEADELQDFIFTMNNFMTDLDANGVALGYTVVSNLGDEVTIPTGALRGLIYNMAKEMAPEFDAQVTPAIVSIAAAGLETMRKLGQNIPTSFYPGTLPVGSGNEGDFNGFNGRHFFPDREAEILAETTGCISLEVNTNDT